MSCFRNVLLAINICVVHLSHIYMVAVSVMQYFVRCQMKRSTCIGLFCGVMFNFNILTYSK